MKRGRHSLVGLFLAIGMTLAAGTAAVGAERTTSQAMGIGVPETFFKNLPPSLAKALTGPLKKLLEMQTGYGIELVMGEDHNALGQQLHNEKTQLAVMHGFEYAWLREKHPELKPLLVAVGDPKALRAYLVVNADSKAECMGDLGNKTMILPPLWKQHCRLFLERHCQELGKKPSEHFSETQVAEQLEQALDAVAFGKSGATIVDEEAIDWYKRRRPNRFKMLKIVAESEEFPATVIVYREGSLSQECVKRVRDGLLATTRSAEGKALLTVCRIAAFEEVPKNYDQQLEAIRKVYPAPAKPEK